MIYDTNIWWIIQLGEIKFTTSVRKIQQSFYNPQNIFVVGLDDWDKLRDFIKSPFAEIPQTVKEQYLFSTWVNSF